MADQPPSRYDDMPDAARELMADFDELDIAEMLASANEVNKELRRKAAEAEAVLREVRSDLLKLYASLPAGLDFYLGKIRMTRLRIDAALGDEHPARRKETDRG